MTLIFEFSKETWFDVINNTPEWDEFRIGGSPGNKSSSKKVGKKKSSKKGGKKKR